MTKRKTHEFIQLLPTNSESALNVYTSFNHLKSKAVYYMKNFRMMYPINQKNKFPLVKSRITHMKHIIFYKVMMRFLSIYAHEYES